MARNTLVNAFSVNVSELKNAIKAEKALEFDDFLADKLRLWKVPVSDDYIDPLSNLSLKNKEELLAIRKILKYFPDSPPGKHIYVLISPLEITATLSQEQELLEEVTSLQALLNKSIHGPNGHGPVNFAIDLLQTARTVSITECKASEIEEDDIIRGSHHFKDENMQVKVEKVLGYITWLLEKAQKPDSALDVDKEKVGGQPYKLES
ncbi:hypothetical protein RhiirA5_435054 [Rhizophagus irregularis]|uniref:Crinkler effector protein N-terminal domain-containing protein n=1 Tax=Rhizophagus irregularis TaxID=588596 RepID=A0A2N0NP00_9GLOM|nr:hypothetical protein RhiirA5_435054 [Rhizophagus irregularis]